MPGATSLIELILKKWGDDIAGAAKELEEKVGFLAMTVFMTAPCIRGAD